MSERPPGASGLRRLLGSFFGAGLIPGAPGTWGSLATVLLVAALVGVEGWSDGLLRFVAPVDASPTAAVENAQGERPTADSEAGDPMLGERALAPARPTDDARDPPDDARGGSGGAGESTGGVRGGTGGARESTGGARDPADGARESTGGARAPADDARESTGGAPHLTDGARESTDDARDLPVGTRDPTDGARISTDGARDRWPTLGAALGALVLVVIVGVRLGHHASVDWGRGDPGPFVLDEVAGQLIAMLPLLPGPLDPLGAGLAFALFRLLDVTKPTPIGRLERLPGGVGIMADDLAAGLAAMVVVALVS